MHLAEIETKLRLRLAGTLPGVEAQVRFAPVPGGEGLAGG